MIEVVIPAHNAEAFLRETLESVAEQTRPPTRVTVVNDRSRDATRAVAEACAAELAPRLTIRVLDNLGPPGPSAARNTAIRASDAPWIALLDADDLLEPRHHATLLAMAEGAAGITVAFGDCCVFDSESGAIRLSSHHLKCGLLDLPAEDAPGGGRRLLGRHFPVLFRGPRVPTSASLLRREAALAAGLFDESMKFAEDADLFLRLAWLGEFRFATERLMRKRTHGSNLTQGANQIHFARGGALVALKCLAIARAASPAPFSPTAEDRRLIEMLAPRAVEHYLQDASRTGWRAYARAARLAWDSGFGAMALKPRHLARMTLFGLRRRIPALFADRGA